MIFQLKTNCPLESHDPQRDLKLRTLIPEGERDPDLLVIAICLFNQSPTKTEGPIRRPLSIQSFDKELRKVCDWNGLSGIFSHYFRRTQLNVLYAKGGH